ncbi:MAG TPA: hypothetical protein VKM54_16065 [Myxococcota bacterium]|nr:hypothetical protein [Myxococcota bacterium]
MINTTAALEDLATVAEVLDGLSARLRNDVWAVAPADVQLLRRSAAQLEYLLALLQLREGFPPAAAWPCVIR